VYILLCDQELIGLISSWSVQMVEHILLSVLKSLSYIACCLVFVLPVVSVCTNI